MLVVKSKPEQVQALAAPADDAAGADARGPPTEAPPRLSEAGKTFVPVAELPCFI